MELNRFFDAAILKPETTQAEARAGIEAMIKARTITVCVRPCDIPLALELCAGTETAVCTVLSFPHGVALSEGKADEGRRYAAMGVAEIDMVANYGLAISGEWDRFRADLAAVRSATTGAVLKVILETSELNGEQIGRATRIAAEEGLDFVKTSTGFASGGATEEAISIMREAAEGRIRLKASGGIRTVEAAERFVELGASRLGVNYTTAAALCGVELKAAGSSGSY